MKLIPILSLWQPWASMIVTPHPRYPERGIKQYETRNWIIKPGDYLIHAAKKWDGWQKDLMYHMSLDDGRKSYFIQYKDLIMPMAFGAIIGKVTFSEHIPSAVFHANGPAYSITPEEEYQFGDWSPNRFGILIKNPAKFMDPLQMRGQQGVWKVPLEELPLPIQNHFL